MFRSIQLPVSALEKQNLPILRGYHSVTKSFLLTYYHLSEYVKIYLRILGHLAPLDQNCSIKLYRMRKMFCALQYGSQYVASSHMWLWSSRNITNGTEDWILSFNLILIKIVMWLMTAVLDITDLNCELLEGRDQVLFFFTFHVAQSGVHSHFLNDRMSDVEVVSKIAVFSSSHTSHRHSPVKILPVNITHLITSDSHVDLITPFYRRRNWGSEKVNDSAKS